MIGSETDQECITRLLRVQASFERLQRVQAFKSQLEQLRKKHGFSAIAYIRLKKDQRETVVGLERRGLWDKLWDKSNPQAKPSTDLIFGLAALPYQSDAGVRRYFELEWQIHSMERLISDKAIESISSKWHIRREDAKSMLLEGDPFLFYKRRKKRSQRKPTRAWFLERHRETTAQNLMIIRLWEESRGKMTPKQITGRLAQKEYAVTENNVSQVLSRYRKILDFKPKKS